jgi:murein L,D-transpeptidase YafK
MGLKPSGYLRGLATSVALAAVVALAGCETDGLYSGKAMREISPELRAELQNKNMPLESSLLVRLFKQEAELEVWKQDAGGRYELLRTYPICRWSGELGPKIREGDRQAPEGFYNITPAQMNPNSQFYLSFNMGYPNVFDKAHGRTGAHLMVHGDCSSRGCYAMTDDQIGEIYSLARESFFGGQRSFQVQAYPFRMTPANFAKHRNNPNVPFWKMLKEGNDHFEITRQEPAVEVCEKRYVFNAQAPQQQNFTPASNGIKLGTPWGGFREAQPQQASLKFNPTGKCPVYEIPAEVLAEVKQKQRQDDQQISSLSMRTIAAPIKTGRDGGMHPYYLAKLKPTEVREADGTVRYMVDESAKKKLGSYVNPPFETYPDESNTTATAPSGAKQKSAPAASSGYMVAAAESKPAPAPARASNESGGMFSSLFASTKSSVGRLFGGDEDKPVSPPAAKAAAPAPKPAPRPQPSATAVAQPKPAAQTQEPEPTAQAAPAPTPARQSAASGASLMNGATPTVPTGSFDQRWGSMR